MTLYPPAEDQLLCQSRRFTPQKVWCNLKRLTYQNSQFNTSPYFWLKLYTLCLYFCLVKNVKPPFFFPLTPIYPYQRQCIKIPWKRTPKMKMGKQTAKNIVLEMVRISPLKNVYILVTSAMLWRIPKTPLKIKKLQMGQCMLQ